MNLGMDTHLERAPRILVVDDESSVRHVLSTVLERKGCEVTTAETAEEALGLLPEADPDVALVDIVLPGRDGIHLLGCIKRQSPETEVVLITSHASVESAIKAIHCGAYDYMRKPFQRLEDIWLTVRRALEKRELSLRMRDLVRQQGARGQEISRAVDRLETPDSSAETATTPEAMPSTVGDPES
jgi:DNA-binding NtrC family response regulator